MFLLCTLLRANASLMAFRKQPCLENISLTFPAVVVFPVGKVYIWRPYFKWIRDVPFWPGQYTWTATAWFVLTRPARPKVWGNFHRFLGNPEQSFSKPKLEKETLPYQCWRRGADRAHGLPCFHSRYLLALERHWIKKFLHEQYY